MCSDETPSGVAVGVSCHMYSTSCKRTINFARSTKCGNFVFVSAPRFRFPPLKSYHNCSWQTKKWEWTCAEAFAQPEPLESWCQRRTFVMGPSTIEVGNLIWVDANRILRHRKFVFFWTKSQLKVVWPLRKPKNKLCRWLQTQQACFVGIVALGNKFRLWWYQIKSRSDVWINQNHWQGLTLSQLLSIMRSTWSGIELLAEEQSLVLQCCRSCMTEFSNLCKHFKQCELVCDCITNDSLRGYSCNAWSGEKAGDQSCSKNCSGPLLFVLLVLYFFLGVKAKVIKHEVYVVWSCDGCAMTGNWPSK